MDLGAFILGIGAAFLMGSTLGVERPFQKVGPRCSPTSLRRFEMTLPSKDSSGESTLNRTFRRSVGREYRGTSSAYAAMIGWVVRHNVDCCTRQFRSDFPTIHPHRDPLREKKTADICGSEQPFP